MPTYQEIYRHLYEVWRLLRFDTSAVDRFDSSPAGFWKSFIAAALVLPVYVAGEMVLPAELPPETAAAGPVVRIAAQAVVYALMWLVFPVVMASFAELMGRGDKFARFIVVYNWASVWQSYFLLPAILFAAASGGAEVLTVALLLVYAFSWYIARTALDISGAVAFGIVAIDVLVSFLLVELEIFLLL